MNFLSQKFDYTNLVIFWIALILFGPYIKNNYVPIRIDHILFPLLSMLIIGLFIKSKKFIFPKFIFPLVGFIIIAMISTVTTIFKTENLFNGLFFMAEIENHLRIIFTLILFINIQKYYPLNIERIIKYLILFSIILAIFGILQLIKYNETIFEFINYISLELYEGKFGGKKSVLEKCLGNRAVSTFYQPGNFSSFLTMIITLFLFSEKTIKVKPIIFYLILTIFILSYTLIISKGFIAGMIFLFSFILLKKQLKKAIYVLLILMSVLYMTKHISPYAIKCYKAYLKNSTSLIKFYNIVFGTRFGKITKVKDVKNNKNETINNGENNYDYKIGKGVLSGSVKSISTNAILGTGYMSNIKSGDSMIIHLLTRSGIIGMVLFFTFIFLLMKQIIINKSLNPPNIKDISEVWIYTCSVFLFFSIAFPVFIQDRTGDIFWILGGILWSKSNTLRENT